MQKPQLETSKLRLLLVDDEVVIREILAAMLEDLPLEIIEASDGAEAWEIFQKEKIDIIVTDIRMPKMDGLMLAEKIISKDFFVPVIVTTAFDDKDHILRALKIGVHDFITKPIVQEFFVDRVKRAMDKRNLQLSQLKVIEMLHELLEIPNENEVHKMNLNECLEYIQELVAVFTIKKERKSERNS